MLLLKNVYSSPGSNAFIGPTSSTSRDDSEKYGSGATTLIRPLPAQWIGEARVKILVGSGVQSTG